MNRVLSDGRPWSAHRGMMCKPMLWPCWPYLPIKRPDPTDKFGIGIECGILYATETPFAHVYIANLFHLPPTLAEFLATAKYHYDSPDALLADGWVVD